MNYLKIVLGLATVAIVLYNIAISIQKTATPYLDAPIHKNTKHQIVEPIKN